MGLQDWLGVIDDVRGICCIASMDGSTDGRNNDYLMLPRFGLSPLCLL